MFHQQTLQNATVKVVIPTERYRALLYYPIAGMRDPVGISMASLHGNFHDPIFLAISHFCSVILVFKIEAHIHRFDVCPYVFDCKILRIPLTGGFE